MKFNVGMLLLRIAAGVSFIAHGYGKIKSTEAIEGTIGYFSSLGFPAFMAYVVGYVELIGGILLILGLWTSIAAAALAVVISVALFYAKSEHLFGVLNVPRFEIDLALLAITVTLALNGSGRYALKPAHGLCCGCAQGNVCEVK